VYSCYTLWWEDNMKEIEKNNSGDCHVCPHSMAFMLDNWLRKLLQNPSKILDGYIKEGDTAIDLGCGPGFFSIPMAKMTGPNGKVIAADLQDKMLTHVKRKASRKKVTDRMTFHQCKSNKVGLDSKEIADFVLAFYMIHETGNPGMFLGEVYDLLKKGGTFLVVEPKMHVPQEKYEELIAMAKDIGFTVADYPKKKGGRSVLFKK
jgi:ubiquinone/menaquinone biosynthesis C-methylase UbiE